MICKNKKRFLSKFTALFVISFAIFSTSISSMAAEPSNIQSIRANLAKALGCKPTDHSIRKALQLTMSNGWKIRNSRAASAQSSLGEVTAATSDEGEKEGASATNPIAVASLSSLGLVTAVSSAQSSR